MYLSISIQNAIGKMSILAKIFLFITTFIRTPYLQIKILQIENLTVYTGAYLQIKFLIANWLPYKRQNFLFAIFLFANKA